MARGGKREGAGRKKGGENKATTEFKEKLNDLLEESAPKMAGWLSAVAEEDPLKAFDILSKFAEYIHPKLSRSELRHEGELSITDILAGIDDEERDDKEG